MIYNTMNKNTTPAVGGGKYTPPYCTITGINAEGVLCSSIEGLGNRFDYVWEDEE